MQDQSSSVRRLSDCNNIGDLRRLAKRKLGQRTLLDVISLKDTQLVKGSHGRPTDDPDDGPIVISSRADLLPEGPVAATAFKQLVLDHVFP